MDTLVSAIRDTQIHIAKPVLFPLYYAILDLSEIDECASSPCDPTGAASCTDGIDLFTCVCNADYTDALCATEILPCDSSPCDVMGASSCTDSGVSTDFVCDCLPGYTGTLCETGVLD